VRTGKKNKLIVDIHKRAPAIGQYRSRVRKIIFKGHLNGLELIQQLMLL
jgi:hypothetical protein